MGPRTCLFMNKCRKFTERFFLLVFFGTHDQNSETHISNIMMHEKCETLKKLFEQVSIIFWARFCLNDTTGENEKNEWILRNLQFHNFVEKTGTGTTGTTGTINSIVNWDSGVWNPKLLKFGDEFDVCSHKNISRVKIGFFRGCQKFLFW